MLGAMAERGLRSAMASWAGGLPSRRGHYRLAGSRVKDALAAPLPWPGCAGSGKALVRAARYWMRLSRFLTVAVS